MNKKRIGLVGLCVWIVGLVFWGCGGDDDDGDYQFRGRVIDFASGKVDQVPKPGMLVKALDNDTGDLLGIEEVTDDLGYVTFKGLPEEGRVGFLSVGVANETMDTYQFNIDPNAQDEILWSVDLGTYQMAPGLAGYTQDPAKGAAAGATYWLDAQGNEVPVGCSTIEGIYDSGMIRYFGGNNLPTKLVADDPIDGRDNVNPLNGYWLVGNIMPVGELVTIEGFVGTQSLGSVSYFAHPNSVTIGNIYYEGASNPQPSDCE